MWSLAAAIVGVFQRVSDFPVIKDYLAEGLFVLGGAEWEGPSLLSNVIDCLS